MRSVLRNSEPEALILGGGPAGAATAVALARKGRSVEIIEQSAAPHHKVCGEFLSREAITYLDALGIDLHALGAAPIHGVRLAARRAIAACDLPFPAVSLSRRALDEALLALAAQAGATILRGRRVNSLARNRGGWTATLAGEEFRSAPAIFLATGKHDLAGHRRPPGKQNNLVAFKMYYRLSLAQERALHGWVELYLFPGGYAGLQLAENGEANLCLLVERGVFAALGHRWSALLAHLVRASEPLAERLDAATPLLDKPLALSSIPYGLIQDGLIQDHPAPSLWRLGDQAAVIPSFSGDGISIALYSARRAVDFYLRGVAADEFARRFADDLCGSVRLATVISRLLIAAPALAHTARLWPPLLRHFAAKTRIPAAAVRI